MCFVGMNEVSKISINLQDKSNDFPPQHMLYNNLLHCFELYLLNKSEEAVNKIEKLKKDKLFQDLSPSIKRIILFFNNSFVYLSKIYINNNTKRSDSLQNQILEIESENLTDVNIIPLYRWIKKELKNCKAI